MAERVLKIKSVSEVAEAISGLKDLEGSLKGVGTAALEASGKSKGEWKALEAEWAKSVPALKGIADNALKVESALNAMGRASSTSQLEAGLDVPSESTAKVEILALFVPQVDAISARTGQSPFAVLNALFLAGLKVADVVERQESPS